MRRGDFTIARAIARLNVGGPAIQAVLLTEAFREKGYKALLLTGEVSPCEGDMEYFAREHDVQPIKIDTLCREVSWRRDLASLWRLVQIFRRESPVVLHTHTAKAGALGRLAAILAGVPVRVHTFHGHVFRGYFSPFVTRVFLAIERFLAVHTDCIVAISESQRRELIEIYKIAPAEKVVTIGLGFEVEQFLNQARGTGFFRERLGVRSGCQLVGWIGRFSSIKDPLLFLDATAKVRARRSAARFVMVGDGDLRAACEARSCHADLHGSVFFTGWKAGLCRVYSDLDLVILTSISEGTPLALLEAMASSKAFIAPDVGGIRDLMAGRGRAERGWEIFDNAILVPRVPDAIADATIYLLERPQLREQMGAAGREFVSVRYSHRRLVADLERLYLQLGKDKGFTPRQAMESPSESAVL